MNTPQQLDTLLEYGIIQQVTRPLMSGKEAQVFVVVAGGEECVAKVYKEASERTFKHRSIYTEGRRTRNSRDERAMAKRTRHGQKKDEDAWRRAEVDVIYRLRDAGVRVPEPLDFAEGVLVMELVKNADGQPAPRLGDLSFEPDEAREIYETLVREVVRMLCAGVIHGDLSEFNVLMTNTGPVIIDFPQSVDPAQNPNARRLLLRDVQNLHRFLARFAPNDPIRPYGEEIWALFEANRLRPDTKLQGRYKAPRGKVDTREVMSLIDDADRSARRRRGEGSEDAHPGDDAGERARAPLRRVVDFAVERPTRGTPEKEPANTRNRRRRNRRGASKPDAATKEAAPQRASQPDERNKPSDAGPANPASRRRRRRRNPRRSGKGSAQAEGSPKPGKEASPSRPASGNAGAAASDKEKSRPTRRRRRRRPNSSPPR